MRKSHLSIALALVMVVGVFSALPAGAATQVPEVVQIDDPQGDANTMGGDQVTPAGNVSSVGDLRKIWFSNNAESLSVHVQTSATPPAGSVGTLYTVLAAPGEGPVSNQTAGCLQFRVYVPAGNAGGTYQGDLKAKLHDRCNEGTNWLDNGVEGEAIIETLDDDTGLITLTFPRSYSPLLEDGKLLSAPTARSDSLAGTDKVEIPTTPATNHSHPWGGLRYDDTKVGTDYEIGAGGAPPVVQEPPTGNEPDEPKKKDCRKKKGKAKKRCKKFNKNLGGETPPPAAPGCAAYVPGEQGAEAETVVVKDEHTAEAPLELVIDQDLGAVRAEISRGHVFANIQVDSTAAEAGLFVRYSFPDHEDHDLYVRYADGALAAQAAGFNPLVEAPLVNDGTSVAGHTERGAEQVDGVRTPDCAGYTADFDNFLGQGGEYTVTMWLGEIENDPQAPAA